MDIDVALKQAQQLIAAGNCDEAKAVLRGVLAQNKRNAQAWYLVSLCMDDPRARAESLRRALLTDPSHTQAKREFEAMDGLTILRPPSLSASMPPRKRSSFPTFLLLRMSILVIAAVIGGFILSRGQPLLPNPTFVSAPSVTPGVDTSATAAVQMTATVKAAVLNALANQQATYNSDADSSLATGYAVLHAQQTATAAAKQP